MRLSEIVERIIILKTAILEHDTASLEKRFPGQKFIRMSDLAANPGPVAPERPVLRAFLMSLPVATIYAIEFIMYLGRGDFDPDEFLERYEQMSDTLDKPEWDVDHMMGKNPLAMYLSDGVKRLSEANIDVDRLLEA